MTEPHADHSTHAQAAGGPARGPMAHGQTAHSHSGHRHGTAQSTGRAFGIAIVLNSLFVVIEFVYGYLANSTALMADAGHNLSDVLGLLLAWGAALLGRRAPSARYTYGLGSSSILAALANAMLLLLACGAIAWEAIGRFAQPPMVASLTVIWVAAVGIAVNGLSAWLFLHGSKSDLNLRGAYLHMAADAAVSLGVVVCGVLMLLTGWYWLDPIVSLLIVAVILIGTWSLLRESTQLALSAVPTRVDAQAVQAYLRQCPGVTDVHDLHIWGMSTTDTALTVHLVMPQGYPGDAALDAITHTLRDRFGIAHSTLQTEQGTTQHACSMLNGLEHPTAQAAAAHRH
jgi:cobalt-zinc-cadmium efflux system protein